MARDADGRYTCVVALRDPGVHNWIDTGGLHQTHAIQKWQGLPRGADGVHQPTIEGRLVKLADLKRVLPPETRWVTPAERAQQLAQREAAFARRLLDR
jgi:hypothetical protein